MKFTLKQLKQQIGLEKLVSFGARAGRRRALGRVVRLSPSTTSVLIVKEICVYDIEESTATEVHQVLDLTAELLEHALFAKLYDSEGLLAPICAQRYSY